MNKGRRANQGETSWINLDDVTIAVIGTGYVGLSLALAFSSHFNVIGYDSDKEKIRNHAQTYGTTHNSTNNTGTTDNSTKNTGTAEKSTTITGTTDKNITDKSTQVEGTTDKGTTDGNRASGRRLLFTSEQNVLEDAQIYIVTVPTPVDEQMKPDLSHLINASQVVGSKLAEGDFVIYESTVYPGVTEEVCIPLLEQTSGLKCGQHFKVGYSPERVSPGDPDFQIHNTKKIISACDEEALEVITGLYQKIVKAGVYQAESIMIAEAAKITENAQRDLNIAFVNEMAMMFQQMGLDTRAVLEACATKHNFYRATPGLVGGHCIGVDSYYLIHRARQKGYEPTLLMAGREINEYMAIYIARKTIERLERLHKCTQNETSGNGNIGTEKLNEADFANRGTGTSKDERRWTIAVLGVTYKENTRDIRNSKVKLIIDELQACGARLYVADPLADVKEVSAVYGIELCDWTSITGVDAVILAVAHEEFRKRSVEDFRRMFRPAGPGLMIDVKGIFPMELFEPHHIEYWRL